MPKGTLTADFSEFYQACQKATVLLNGFESDAGKVEKSLNRLSNSFTGTKIQQEATLMAEAVERAGGAAKLTEKEMARVNATLTEAIAKYAALGQEAPKALTDMEAATRKTGSATSEWLGSFGEHVTSTMAGMVSAQAIIGGVSTAFRTLSTFVLSSVESFAAAEAAEKKMTVALQAQGAATPAAVAGMNALASSYQNTTKYSDDLISEMQALLIQVGGVMPAEMDKALKASTDLASGLGVDLASATTLVAKAFEGNVSSLEKYGIKIDDAKFKAQGMPAVLDAIQQRFGGQAAAELDTYAGKLAHVANSWDNVKEAIGKAAATNPIVETMLRTLDDATGSATLGIDDTAHSWSNLLALVGNPSGFAGAIRSLEDMAAAANANARATRENIAAQQAMDSAMSNIEADLAARAAEKVREQQRQAAALKEHSDKLVKEAKEAAERESKRLKELTADIYGGTAIKAANDYVIAVGNVSNVTRATAEQQERINVAVSAALAAYKALGEEAPPAMTKLYLATLQVPDVVKGVGTALAGLGAQVEVNKTAYANWQTQATAADAAIQKASDEQYAANERAIAAAGAAANETKKVTAANQELAASYQLVARSAAEWSQRAALAEYDAQRNMLSGSALATQMGMFQTQQAASYRQQAGQAAYRENMVASAGGGGAWGGPGGGWTVNVHAVNNLNGDQIAQALVDGMRRRGISPGGF
jgi:hypothetical protein